MVLRETKLTESDVSLPNLAENIVVIAAVGALQDIRDEISIVPRTPQMYITPKAISGKTKSLSRIANRHLMLRSPSEILLFAK